MVHIESSLIGIHTVCVVFGLKVEAYSIKLLALLAETLFIVVLLVL